MTILIGWLVIIFGSGIIVWVGLRIVKDSRRARRSPRVLQERRDYISLRLRGGR